LESLKLLISAYACEPGKGSEPGVGWRWALESARLGHEVWVITRENNRPGIAAGLAAAGPAAGRMHFVHYDLPPALRRWKRGGRGVHLYYLLWQWGAWRVARRLHAEQRFDAVQHLTFGVIRQPSFMGRLGIPFVLGPVGGGERAPLALRRHFPWRGWLRDGLRDLVNFSVRFDPFVRGMMAQATLILVKTPETLAWLPARHRGKAQTMLEIGIDARPDTEQAVVRPAAEGLRLLYVGRFLDLKGMEFGLRALAALHARGQAATLTLIGNGPEARHWQHLAEALGVSASVNWIAWMKHDELLAAYAAYDAFVFPSLRDSSGNVVLEAMAGGLPVVCLDLGGPAQMVDASCGRVVPASGLGEAEVVARLADALAEFASSAELVAGLRAGARARAGQFAWRRVVARVWGEGGLGYAGVVGDGRRRFVFGHA